MVGLGALSRAYRSVTPCSASALASNIGRILGPAVPAAVVPDDSARKFSSFSLRRPPFRRVNPYDPDGIQDNRPGATLKWRAHAVSLNLGDYSDDERHGSASQPEAQGVATAEGQTFSMDPNDRILLDRHKKEQAELKAKKDRWLKNAEPPVRVPKIDEQGNAQGRGTRKTAHASVFIHPGFGHVVVNGKDISGYFARESDRDHLLAPLVATDTCGRFDVTALTFGGGLRGQAGAIRLGLARALNNYNPDVYRPPLKRLGYLTRDPRMVERKKIGHVKARKKPQWVRR